MTKRKGIFDVNVDLNVNAFSVPLNRERNSKKDNGITIEQALRIIIRQMEVSGARPRTIYDYELIVGKFQSVTKAEYVLDITNELIYQWLESMNVKNQTKLTRLKCLKAYLGRCFDNGWVQNKFWRNINVKVDQQIKEGATDKDIEMLMSILDFNTFLDLRNGTAVLLMYKTGIRIATLSKLESHHIDLENKTLNLDGKLMKNHKGLKLPFDDQLAYLLNILLQQNEPIRREYRQFNDYVFITNKGEYIGQGITSNAIQKQLNKYTRRYGIKNISPHALRRGFATNLLRKNANINLISRALGHSDLGVTSKYLSIDMEETAIELRDYL
ncbi:site-specific integrase [Rummeliibacillus sp. TYF-LIM-RU47]|uniref:tyrosine-type recombinase/integrase n=1 Tax=Rummeliibacillus sp. TYF-LIM-RU47 TaxID=2608406 RepID=UPI001239CCE9|nr:site-specific integrase [Rummeliibacillus sp. TYF-LIM-RU47]